MFPPSLDLLISAFHINRLLTLIPFYDCYNVCEGDDDVSEMHTAYL
jgi:hypothetical protein